MSSIITSGDEAICWLLFLDEDPRLWFLRQRLADGFKIMEDIFVEGWQLIYAYLAIILLASICFCKERLLDPWAFLSLRRSLLLIILRLLICLSSLFNFFPLFLISFRPYFIYSCILLSIKDLDRVRLKVSATRIFLVSIYSLTLVLIAPL